MNKNQKLTANQVSKLLSNVCVRNGGMKKWAYANGLNPTYVKYTIQGRYPPAQKICKALGIKRVVKRVITYVKE